MTTKPVSEIMTRDPVTISTSATVTEAAELMCEHDIGDVLVVDDEGMLRGILTDRDIVVRTLASGRDPVKTPVERVCSSHVTKLEPGETLENAFELVHKKGIRRIPIVEGGKPIGIVTLGDLSLHRYPGSALGELSKLPPNR